MKKKVLHLKKLHLNKSTISQLSAQEANNIAGGINTLVVSNCIRCLSEVLTACVCPATLLCTRNCTIVTGPEVGN